MIGAEAPPLETGADFRLGPWTVQPALHRLCDGDTTCQVGHKVMAVLLLLAEEPGRVVRKDELIDAVWGGAFTSDEALTTVVYELRKALGDDARQPRYVETIRKGGYRLVAPVEPVVVAEGARAVAAEVVPEVAPEIAIPEAPEKNRSTAPDPMRTVNDPRPAPASTRRVPPLAWLLGAAALLAVFWIAGRSTPADESLAAVGPVAPSEDRPLPVGGDRGILIDGDPPAPPSLAVLPLASFGEQCRQDSFAGGLTEMLIADLAASVPMEVLPSLSTRVVDDRWSLDDIATKLEADLVVEGTVVRAGERMWLSVQLVDIATGKMLWGGSYERSVDDSLEQQRALALEIAEEVGRYANPLPTDRPDLALPPSTGAP